MEEKQPEKISETIVGACIRDILKSHAEYTKNISILMNSIKFPDIPKLMDYSELIADYSKLKDISENILKSVLVDTTKLQETMASISKSMSIYKSTEFQELFKNLDDVENVNK